MARGALMAAGAVGAGKAGVAKAAAAMEGGAAADLLARWRAFR